MPYYYVTGGRGDPAAPAPSRPSMLRFVAHPEEKEKKILPYSDVREFRVTSVLSDPPPLLKVITNPVPQTLPKNKAQY